MLAANTCFNNAGSNDCCPLAVDSLIDSKSTSKLPAARETKSFVLLSVGYGVSAVDCEDALSLKPAD